MTVLPSFNALHRHSTNVVIALVMSAAVAGVTAHVLNPLLDPRWVPVSEYGLGENGLPMRLMFLLLGVACLILQGSMRTLRTNWQLRVGRRSLALGGFGFLMAGLFTPDSILAGQQQITTTAIVHSLGAVFADFVAVASLLYAIGASRAKIGDGTLRIGLWLGALLAWGGLAGAIVAMAKYMPESGQLGPDVPIGWSGRYMIAAFAAWIVLASVLLPRIAKDGQRQATVA